MEAYKISVIASDPLGPIWVLNWVGLDWGWAWRVGGLKVWGQGLTDFILIIPSPVKAI